MLVCNCNCSYRLVLWYRGTYSHAGTKARRSTVPELLNELVLPCASVSHNTAFRTSAFLGSRVHTDPLVLPHGYTVHRVKHGPVLTRLHTARVLHGLVLLPITLAC